MTRTVELCNELLVLYAIDSLVMENACNKAFKVIIGICNDELVVDFDQTIGDNISCQLRSFLRG